jgi:hypothetical protein
VFERIALLPLEASEKEGGGWVRCPIYETLFAEGTIATGGEETLRALIVKHLKPRVELISIDTYEDLVYAAIHSSLLDSYRDLAVILNRFLGTDAILVGTLARYEERGGGPYAVSRPASVAFGLYLLDGKKGDLVWRFRFDETQRSLSENLLALSSFWERKGRWLTAEELAETGVADMVNTFPQGRDTLE